MEVTPTSNKPLVKIKRLDKLNFILLAILFVLLTLLVTTFYNYFQLNARFSNYQNIKATEVSNLEKKLNSIEKPAATKNIITSEVLYSNPLATKTYNEELYTAYFLPKEDGQLHQDFIIKRGRTSIILSNASIAGFFTDNLFDFAGNNLVVINHKDNSIDIYNVENQNSTYVDSIVIPEDATGTSYNIICQNSTCSLLRALNMHEACEIELDIRNRNIVSSTCNEE